MDERPTVRRGVLEGLVRAVMKEATEIDGMCGNTLNRRELVFRWCQERREVWTGVHPPFFYGSLST